MQEDPEPVSFAHEVRVLADLCGELLDSSRATRYTFVFSRA